MITKDELEWLTDLFAADRSKFTTWESGFVADMEQRCEQYGTETRISPKQWHFLRKIGEEKCGLSNQSGGGEPDYQ